MDAIRIKVIEEMNSLLLRPFTRLDIEMALKNMAPDKLNTWRIWFSSFDLSEILAYCGE